MDSARLRSRARGLVLTAGAVGATLLLAGCVNQAASPTPGSSAPTTSSTASSSPSASATPTAAPGTPVTIACAAILTAQQVYNYNPNYVATKYTPGPGTLGAQAATDSGRVCGWLDETSNAILEVAVAQPAPSDLASLRATATSGTAVQLGGSAMGYFQVGGGVGTLQVFTGNYWVVISSAAIGAESDADPIATDVLANLPKG